MSSSRLKIHDSAARLNLWWPSILVNPDLTVVEAHAIADTLEQSLHEKIAQPVNVMVHVEPKMY